jgi:hypothetical protein
MQDPEHFSTQWCFQRHGPPRVQYGKHGQDGALLLAGQTARLRFLRPRVHSALIGINKWLVQLATYKKKITHSCCCIHSIRATDVYHWYQQTAIAWWMISDILWFARRRIRKIIDPSGRVFEEKYGKFIQWFIQRCKLPVSNRTRRQRWLDLPVAIR